MAIPKPNLYFEQLLWQKKYQHIAGIDEVGRGCLAGPVVAAAVILPQGHTIAGIHDSKMLSPKKREIVEKDIYAQAIAVGIGVVEPQVIDEINILQASIVAMKQAIVLLRVQPHYLLVDGNLKPISRLPQLSIVQGDRKSQSIAAASIVAKVFRDRLMDSYHQRYPHYGFLTNKGYPTSEHVAALRRHGSTDIHRKTFQGVRV